MAGVEVEGTSNVDGLLAWKGDQSASFVADDVDIFSGFEVLLLLLRRVCEGA